MAYVNKCRELYQIAFFQWRLKNKTKHTNIEEVKELIKDRINYTYCRYSAEDYEKMKINERTKSLGAVTKDFYFSYFAYYTNN